MIRNSGLGAQPRPVANDPYEKWSHQTAHRSFTWPIASRAPSIFSVPRKNLSHDFSSQVALEASYHAAKHFFSIGPFRLQFSTSYLFQIWSLFRMSHPSMSLSKGLPQSQRLPRV